MQLQLQRLESEFEEQVNNAHISDKNLEKANLQIGRLSKDVDNYQKNKERSLLMLKELFPGAIASFNRTMGTRRKKLQGTTSRHIYYYFIIIK